MFKKLFFIALLILLITSSFNVFAADTGLPKLYLTVEQSPLKIYPPMMIYTATVLDWPLPITSNVPVMVDFWNGPAETMPPMVLIGSVPLDLKTGIAVLNKQMLPGSYKAVAQTTINSQTFVSNTVYYKVP